MREDEINLKMESVKLFLSSVELPSNSSSKADAGSGEASVVILYKSNRCPDPYCRIWHVRS